MPSKPFATIQRKSREKAYIFCKACDDYGKEYTDTYDILNCWCQQRAWYPAPATWVLMAVEPTARLII